MSLSTESAAIHAERFMVAGFGRRAIKARLGASLGQEWEDALQDCMLGFLENCHRAENPEAFFCGIVNHVSSRYIRGAIRRRKRAIELDESTLQSGETAAPEDMQAAEKLAGIVSRLPALYAAQFREWKQRGFRCDTHAQRAKVSRIMKALRVAAGCEGKRTRLAFMKRAAAN